MCKGVVGNMNKEIEIEGKKTPEGRLKIKEIKKLSFQNRAYSLLRIFGIVTCLFIDYECYLSLFGELFGYETDYSFIVIIAAWFFSQKCRRTFIYDISKDRDINNKRIVVLKNEILKDDDQKTK